MFWTIISAVLRASLIDWRNTSKWRSKAIKHYGISIWRRTWSSSSKSTCCCLKSLSKRHSKSNCSWQKPKCYHYLKKYDCRWKSRRSSFLNLRRHEKSGYQRHLGRYTHVWAAGIFWWQWTFTWVFDSYWEIFEARRHISSLELYELGCANFESNSLEWGDAIRPTRHKWSCSA